jgi:hypothetical protein
MGFLLNKVTLRQAVLPVFRCFPVCIIAPMLHTVIRHQQHTILATNSVVKQRTKPFAMCSVSAPTAAVCFSLPRAAIFTGCTVQDTRCHVTDLCPAHKPLGCLSLTDGSACITFLSVQMHRPACQLASNAASLSLSRHVDYITE